MSDTQWNGEPCTALRVTAIVADNGAFPMYWARHLVGTRRNAVQVEYASETFYIDDEDGSGWNKVTHGGSPRWAHSNITIRPDSVQPRGGPANADGYPSIGFARYTAAELAALIEPVINEGEDGWATPFDDDYGRGLAEKVAKAIIHREGPAPMSGPAATEATEAAESPLREQIAAAIYERNNPGSQWAKAHPDDRIAYGTDADATLAVILPAMTKVESASGQAWGCPRTTLDNSVTSSDGAVICGHTIDGGFGRPLGPCLGTPDHKELWHRDANGAEWRPRSRLSRLLDQVTRFGLRFGPRHKAVSTVTEGTQGTEARRPPAARALGTPGDFGRQK